MADKLSVERDGTAVLIMDYQTDIVGYLENPQAPPISATNGKGQRVLPRSTGLRV